MSVKVKSTGGAGGSANVVNGIIESYLANTETIDANNFVEFIKKIEIGDNYDSLITMNTSISNQNDCVSSKLNPTWGLALSDDKVLIIYKGISEYKGVFCRVDTNSISASTPFTFLQSTDYGTPKGIIQLDSNRFLLITLKYQSDFSYYLAYGVVGTINNESIVFGDFTSLTYMLKNETISLCLVKNNMVVMVGQGGASSSSTEPTIWSITINDTAIQYRAADTIQSETCDYVLKVCKVGMGKAFVIYSLNDVLYGIVCECYASYFSMGTPVQIFSGHSNSVDINIEQITTGKVLILASNKKYNYDVAGVVCSVTDRSIKVGTPVNIVNEVKYGKGYLYKINEDKYIYFFHKKKNSSDETYSYGMVLITVSDTTLIVGENQYILSGVESYNNDSSILAISISENNLKSFLSYTNYENDSNTSYMTLYGSLIEFGNIVKYLSLSSTKIDGITKTVATTETPGEVWVLNNAT